MKKTSLFLKQCFAILTMGAVLFSISCSESDLDLDIGDDDDDIIIPDVDDDDDVILPDDSDAIAKFVAYLETYTEYIPTTSVETLEYIDAEFAADPDDIEGIIELHADAIAEAAKGLVITSVENDVDTLFITYKNAGVGGSAALYKGGVDVLVSDKTATSIVTIEVGEYSFSFPKGYANNISGLTCEEGKIAMAPGAKSTIDVTIETIDDVSANGYINHISGFAIYTDAVESTKSALAAVSPNLLRVVSAEFASSVNKKELTLSMLMSSEATVGWGSVSIQYGMGTKTDDITLTTIETSEVQSIAYGVTTTISYDPNVIDKLSYSYDPDDANYVNSFNLYFTGVDNSGSVVVNDALLSEELAVDSYEIRLYEILGSDATSGEVPVNYANDKNLLLGTSEEKAAILSEIVSDVNVANDNLYLGSLGANALDYISAKTSDDATIAFNIALSALSPDDTKTKVYLMVVSGTTTNTDENNCFVVSNVISIKNDAEVYMRVYQETESIYFKAGVLEVPIESNYYWYAKCNADWITLSAEEGELDYTLELSYEENILYSDRSTTLTISAEKEDGTPIEYVVEITQIEADLAYISLSRDTEYITYVEGSMDLEVEANVEWKVSAKPDWVTITAADDDYTMMDLGYMENETGALRVGIVAFQFTDPVTLETKTEAVTLYQDGEVSPTISISDDQVAVGSRGESFTVDISSNFDWSITSDQDWVTIPVASGNYDKTDIVINYDVNLYEFAAREATVTFTAGDDVKTLTITQDKAPQPASVTYSSAAYDFTDLTYTLATDRTLTEMFGDNATVDNLEGESSVEFTIALGNGFQYASTKTVTYGVDDEGHVLMTIPMSLSTYGTFTAESSISYGSETVRMDVDFYANSYPITFQCNLEEMTYTNTSTASTLAVDDPDAYACFQYSELRGLIEYDHDVGQTTVLSTGLVPLGFIEPIDDDQIYLTNSGSSSKSSSLYCTYVYIADDDPTAGHGSPTKNTTYNWTYFNAKTYLVASGATQSGTSNLAVTSWAGTALQYAMTTRSAYIYADVEYRVYALVTFTTGTTACYDTGFKFKIYYAG